MDIKRDISMGIKAADKLFNEICVMCVVYNTLRFHGEFHGVDKQHVLISS